MTFWDSLTWYSSSSNYCAAFSSNSAGQLNITTPSGSTAGVVFNGHVTIGSNGPVIASGFGTGPSIPVANGTAAFQVHVGTSLGATGTLTMPTAVNGWACDSVDLSENNSTQFYLRQTASTTTSVTLTMFASSGSSSSFVSGDFLSVKCTGY